MKTSLLLITLFTSQVWGQVQKKPVIFEPDPLFEECRQSVDDINYKYRIHNYYDDFCRSPKDQKKFIQGKKEYQKCVEKILQTSSANQDLLRKCQNSDLRKALFKDEEFSKCLKTTKNMGLADSPLDMCRNRQFQGLLQNEKYHTCLDNHREAFPHNSMYERTRICSNPKTMENLSGKSFSTCKEELKALKINLVERIRYCIYPSNQEDAKIAALKTCEAQIRPLTGEGISGFYCLKTSLSLKAINEKSLECFSKQTAILEEGYFAKEEQSRSALYVFEALLRGCQKERKVPALPEKAKLAFHSAKFFSINSSFDYTLIGGLSGLNYDADKGILHAVSDDPGTRNPTRFFSFDITASESLSLLPSQKTTLSTSLNTWGWKESSGVDAEGILVTDSGDTVISTETLLKGSKSFIKIYQPDGKQSGEILLTGKFVPKKGRVERVETYLEYPRPQSPRPFPSRPGNEEQVRPIERTRRIFTEELVSGIFPNKGFESLAGSRDGKIIFTANEAPLAQDKAEEKKIVRIVKLVKENEKYGTASEFAYQLDDMKDNGLVDLVYVSENRLLALERSYDSGANKVSARIFEVSLEKAHDYKDVESFSKMNKETPLIVVEKKLLIDLDEVLPFLPEGLNKIDNIEGISFGPKLPNGNKSLILVSDNNFSQTQLTQFIVLEFLK